jgi:hypothetical protein
LVVDRRSMAKITLSNHLFRIALSLLPLVAGIAIGLWQVKDESGAGRAPFAALACACAVFLVVIALLELVTHTSEKNTVRKSFGWLSIVIGDDGFLSTSKVQAALWTFGLAFAISFLDFSLSSAPSSRTARGRRAAR